jgi:hypothetical protein
MIKVAIVILADTETHEGLGRVVNALEAAKELKETGDDVRVVFDGAGTRWVPALAGADHKLHGLYKAVGDKVVGVCAFCAGAFGAKAGVEATGVPFLSEYDGHPSFRKLLAGGYQILTF